MGNGRLDAITGCMFAGKTRELIRRIASLKAENFEVCVLKPSIDDRYSQTEIVSHDGFRCQALIVPTDCSKLPDFPVIVIDEVQFFQPSVVEAVQASVRRGCHVIVAGLDLDSNAQPFGPVPALLAFADEVLKLKAECVVCSSKAASRTYRLSSDTGTILVGGADAYQPRCLACFESKA
jgi:thymidine kinase